MSACAVLVAFVFGVGSASAALPAADLTVQALAVPSTFSEGEGCGGNVEGSFCDSYRVRVRNAGSEPTDGTPIVIVDALPAGLSVLGTELYVSSVFDGYENVGCEGVTAPAGSVGCRYSHVLVPDEWIELVIDVSVNAGAPQGATADAVTVSGGGTQGASASVQGEISSTPSLFGFEGVQSLAAGVDGMPDTQAGDHPYELTTRINLSSERRVDPEDEVSDTSVKDVKDVVVDLPVGLTGSALSAPQCTLAQLVSGCPADTQVGHIQTQPAYNPSVNGPLYNMVPEHGVAAEFGFVDQLHGAHVLYSSVVPTPGGYVLRTTSPDIPQVTLTDIEVTLYGDPAAKDGSGNTPVAMFTNSSDCSGEALVTDFHMDSWQSPGGYNADGTPDLGDLNWVSGTSAAPPVAGCEQLRFEPTLGVQPETTTADSPTGLEVDMKVPQSEAPGTLATPPLRNASVTLAAGLTVNPSAAGGLGACTEAQIGLGDAAQPSCPESSKIGSVEVTTPALAGVLEGSIYLATQNENPFHSLLAGYIVVDDPTTGVLLKEPGELTLNPGTGQITGVFDDNPQFPFSDLKLHFFGGARGVLATPEACGADTTTSDLMPWSAPESGPDATPVSSFSIGSGCVGGFTPVFSAGSENPQAGAYAPFTLSFSRGDGEQNLAGATVTLPEGLLGKVAGIPLCPEAQASAGACPEASQVGSVQASAGVGPDPYWVSGHVYLTGAYNGGPYGLVEEVPAVAGPFNLGTVVVRQALRIDPTTAQVTAVSDALPTTLDGIPLRVRTVDVTLDRSGFTFNPTNCTPMQVTGTLTSTEGASAKVSSRFQAGGCRELPFAPKFTLSTQAKTSKQNGASLTVKGAFPTGEANIHSVAVVLPKQLPARLTTIQQACPEATFAANPATCPAGSLIGTATATTPVLATPVVGPTYLVSHGGAAFPNVTAVLQGEGVTVDLVGSVNIKKGITSSDFAAVPDAPIGTFQLSLPEGPHSGLAAVLPAKAKGDMCATSLTMPFTVTGQNGAQVKQNVKIAVTGCPKPKKKTTTKAKHRKKGTKG